MGRFDGKVALVTGGGRGIGRAVVEQLLVEGALVMVTGRREAARELTEGRDDRVAYRVADVARRGDPRRAVDAAIERFGRLDVLVNNAGTFVRKPLADTTDDDIALMLDVNVRGVLAFCREATPHLERTRGAVVNVSSAAARYVRAGLAAYGAAKAAVDHATRILAAELGPRGVRVNAVAPGMTRTDMTAPLFEEPRALEFLVANTALGRVGEPDDVARAIVYLASDDAAWITGQIVAASGGLLL